MFLHPSQRALVELDFAGPARVAGSAGTGKTVVAIHRAVRLARENPGARVLLATFSDPLAEALERKVTVLAPETGSVVPRIKTASFRGIASELFQLEFGAKPRIASDKVIRQLVVDTARELGINGWVNVIDAWGSDRATSISPLRAWAEKAASAPNVD